MDGLPETFAAADGRSFAAPVQLAGDAQRTLKRAIGCVGIGLHSGSRAQLTLRPAPSGHGIVFRRTDLGRDIPARFDRVTDTRLCTVLATETGDAQVATVEHVLAALAGCRIDNALVEVDGPEIPIFDGSAAPFVFLIDCAGAEEQSALRREIEVLRPVRVEQGSDAFAELRPHDQGGTGLELDMSIAFAAPAIGRQHLATRLDPDGFRRDIAHARTFAQRAEIDALRASGRALGGSLENAVVVDGARVLNPAGLRMPDEFVRHKLLDAVGDLALAGCGLCGCFTGHRSGHALNNRLLHALFADPAAWREIPAGLPAWLSAA